MEPANGINPVAYFRASFPKASNARGRSQCLQPLKIQLCKKREVSVVNKYFLKKIYIWIWFNWFKSLCCFWKQKPIKKSSFLDGVKVKLNSNGILSVLYQQWKSWYITFLINKSLREKENAMKIIFFKKKLLWNEINELIFIVRRRRRRRIYYTNEFHFFKKILRVIFFEKKKQTEATITIVDC